MKVLYLTHRFPPCIGGVQVVGANLVRALSQRGHEFVVVTSHDGPKLPDLSDYEGIPVHRFRFGSALEQRNLPAIREIADRTSALKRLFRPELVHMASSEVSFLLHGLTRTAHPSKTLVTLHETSNDAPAEHSVARRTLRSADWIVAVSRAVLDDLHKVMPETANHSSTILNALEMPALEPSAPLMEPPHLLGIGRLIPEKGFDLALDAMPLLIAQFPSVRLLIAGDGTMRPRLEQQAQQLGIADAVEFLGWVAPEKIPALIDRSSMVVMPSRWREPFGLVALQAAQMGRPIVASHVGGLPEVVADQETGLLIDKENPRAIADAVAALLSDPKVARQMGQAARARALQHFSIDKCADEYDALYRRLVAEGA